jgi:hydrogenase expression/formation protein HypC
LCLAVPGLVLSVSTDEAPLRTARLSFGGLVKEVSVAFVPDAAPGEYLLVHVGFAIARIAEEEARRVFEYLRLAGELVDEAEGGERES